MKREDPKDTYEDIMDLPHHVSPTRARMSMHDRAAQFAPFAALTGFGRAIEETARLTEVQNQQSLYEEEWEDWDGDFWDEP